jgi:hypothetical protein
MTATPDAFNLEDALAVLERTPATLDAMLRGLPEVWLRATEGTGTWSPFDVVGHLIHGERTDWMARTRHILSGETRPFTPFDREAQFAMDPREPLGTRLATFASLRAANLATLRGMQLTAEQLRLTGQHPDFGTVTLAQLLATWTVHDLTHLAQVSRTMAKVYGEAVGPWRAYLSIRGDREPRP